MELPKPKIHRVRVELFHLLDYLLNILNPELTSKILYFRMKILIPKKSPKPKKINQ